MALHGGSPPGKPQTMMNPSEEGLARARWWHIENGLVRCDLCPHACLLKPGGTGLCGVRKASSNGDALLALNAGFAASINLDPVEKKPLYHWRPGTEILSAGTVGCNLRCPFCQNWELARWDPSISLQPVTPESLLEAAKQSGSRPSPSLTTNPWSGSNSCPMRHLSFNGRGSASFWLRTAPSTRNP